ncbi:MAG: family 78 glycoside hydrolase catalytic domain [Phycisphaerae bacterium]|nr:family 78 glycoside hydrolase catalytic domain [Phycisphaerae bacterium]
MSSPARFETGMMTQDNWKGQWICDGKSAPEKPEQFFEDDPAPMFRKSFKVGGQLTAARLYISGLGYYDATLNGKPVGDVVLDPGWTNYGKHVYYSVYDVTALLQRGDNAIGVTLGNGWYNPLPMKLFNRFNLREVLTIGRPKLIANLRLEYADGRVETIATDTSWKTAPSGLLRNNIYLGEFLDARKQTPGWDQPAFDDSAWANAVESKDKTGPLVAQFAPPIRVNRTIPAKAITEPKPGVFVVDLGENFAGWLRADLRGAPGTRIELQYGELLKPDGNLNPMTTVACQLKGTGMGGPGTPIPAVQKDVVILGDKPLTYTPRFTFHGFRFVEITGLAEKPSPADFTGLALAADLRKAGQFACSNDRINAIQQMVLRTFLSNVFSVQSDCPARERFGYGGDIVATSEAFMYNFDMSGFYAKAVLDFAADATPDGGLTELAPFMGIADRGYGGVSGPVGWGLAHPLLVWNLYQYYGDRRNLEQQYETARHWVEFLSEKAAKDFIVTQCISDHESIDPKPEAVTATSHYYQATCLAAAMANELGKSADQKQYADLADKIRSAFVAKFINNSGKVDIGTQGAQSFALYMDLVPSELRTKAFDRLVSEITNTHKGHLATGIFATQYMLDQLTQFGRADLAYGIVNQNTFPGWGWMLQNGATTMWEHWEKEEAVYSHNHPMFGSVSEWFYKALAGINAAPGSVGFDKVVIAPQIVGDLQWVRASYNSIRGNIISDWKLDGDTLQINVTIPANTTAEVWIPSSASIIENGKPVDQAEGVRAIQYPTQPNGSTSLRIGSGSYHFETYYK